MSYVFVELFFYPITAAFFNTEYGVWKHKQRSMTFYYHFYFVFYQNIW